MFSFLFYLLDALVSCLLCYELIKRYCRLSFLRLKKRKVAFLFTPLFESPTTEMLTFSCIARLWRLWIVFVTQRKGKLCKKNKGKCIFCFYPSAAKGWWGIDITLLSKRAMWTPKSENVIMNNEPIDNIGVSTENFGWVQMSTSTSRSKVKLFWKSCECDDSRMKWCRIFKLIL